MLLLQLEDHIPPVVRGLIDQIRTEAAHLGLAVYLVGGPVRDLLLNRPATDLDFTVEGDAALFVDALIMRYGGKADFNGSGLFGTAKWIPDKPDALPVIDFARTRRETYKHPGALPTVDPGWVPIATDLLRRDFTISAMAINIISGDLIDPYGGEADLSAGLIRVLHDQSFIDDPTRLFRAARLGARLQFQIEPHTSSLIPTALPVIDQLSSERITNEIERIFAEAEPEYALLRLDAMNVLRHVQPDLQADDWLIAAFRALRWRFDAVRPGVIVMPDIRLMNYWAILACRAAHVFRFRLARAVKDAISNTRRVYLQFAELSGNESPSVYVPIFENCPVFSAWAIAPLAANRVQLDAFENHWRHVFPILNGVDLQLLGLRPGPVFRTILHRLRDSLLDGEISTLAEERALVESWIAQNLYS